jgi:hypothetical protein
MREWWSSETRGRATTETDVRIVPHALGAQLVDQPAREVLLYGDDRMAVTNTNDSASTTTAVVTIRVPCGADGDLVTDAEERLSRVEDVNAVTIDELHSIDPKLSATIITVKITLHWTATMTDEEISDRLAEVSGLESIQWAK